MTEVRPSDSESAAFPRRLFVSTWWRLDLVRFAYGASLAKPFAMSFLSTPARPFLRFVFPVAFTLGIAGCTAAGESGPMNTDDVAERNPAGGSSKGDIGDEGLRDERMVAVDDSVTTLAAPPPSGLRAGGSMQTTANVNLRKGAGTSFALLSVIPSGTEVKLVSATPKDGFFNVDFNGTTGWSSATYLTPAGSEGGGSTGDTPGDSGGGPSPSNAFARAKLAVGFSYFWGGGSWRGAGVSSSTAGSCSGSCPSCTHSGRYGADCSGLVAKAWQFGEKSLEVDSHPYSTEDFVDDREGRWSTVSRDSLKKGDALAYNSDGHGHIVLYEKGDSWGTPTVVECRGCSYGCVYNARSFASNYKGVRRSGF